MIAKTFFRPPMLANMVLRRQLGATYMVHSSLFATAGDSLATSTPGMSILRSSGGLAVLIDSGATGGAITRVHISTAVHVMCFVYRSVFGLSV